jgi:hypothetical protein
VNSEGYDVRDIMGTHPKPHEWIPYDGYSTKLDLAKAAVKQAKAHKEALLDAADQFTIQLLHWRCDTRMHNYNLADQLYKHDESWFVPLTDKEWADYRKWVDMENIRDDEAHTNWLSQEDRYSKLEDYNAFGTWGHSGPNCRPIYDSDLKSGRLKKPLVIDLLDTLSKADKMIEKTVAGLDKLIKLEQAELKKRKATESNKKWTKKVKMGLAKTPDDSDSEELPELPTLAIADNEPDVPGDLEGYADWAQSRHLHWCKIKVTRRMESQLEAKPTGPLDTDEYDKWPKGLRHLHYKIKINIDTKEHLWSYPWSLLSLALQSNWRWTNAGETLLLRLEQAF